MILETKNLWLRTSELDDVNTLHMTLWSDYQSSKADLWKPSQKVQDSEKLMKTMFATKHTLFFTVIKKEDRNQIGFVTITKSQKEDSVIDNIGLSFSSPEAHKGYGIECLLITLEFCFSKLNVKKIRVSYLKDVGVSNNIRTLFGFVDDEERGETKAIRKYTNEELDVVNLVLTKEKWQEQKHKVGIRT